MKSGFLKHLKDLIKPSNSIKQQPKDDLAKENDESQNQTTRNHELSIVSMRILVARFNKERRKRELKKLKKREKKKEKAKKKREKKKGMEKNQEKNPTERASRRPIRAGTGRIPKRQPVYPVLHPQNRSKSNLNRWISTG